MGLSAKYLQEQIDDIRASGFALDVGFLYKAPIDFLNFGLAVQNLGPRIRYEDSRENLPLTYRAGLAYQLPYHAVTFTLDALKLRDEKMKINTGVEVKLFESIALRGGYQFQKDVGDGYNLGLGFEFLNDYNFNYVFSPYGILGNTHRVDFVFKFGDVVKQKSSMRQTVNRQENRIRKTSYLNDTREIKDTENVPAPAGLRADKAGKKVILSWKTIPLKYATYNIYVQLHGKTGIVKVNKKPVSGNEFTFRPSVDNLDVTFYVTAVYNHKESVLSEPLKFEVQM